MERIVFEDSRSIAAYRSASGSRVPSSGSRAPSSRRTSNGGNGGKVKECQFSPKTLRLAVASKSHVRMMTLYHNQGPFPPSTQIGRLEFAWETVRDTSKTSGDAVLVDALKRVSRDDLTKKRLMTFVSHVLSFLSLLIFFDS